MAPLPRQRPRAADALTNTAVRIGVCAICARYRQVVPMPDGRQLCAGEKVGTRTRDKQPASYCERVKARRP